MENVLYESVLETYLAMLQKNWYLTRYAKSESLVFDLGNLPRAFSSDSTPVCPATLP